MDLDVSKEEREFREKVRDWLQENKPREARPRHSRDAVAFDKAWQRKLFDAGYAGVNWPKEFGGAGLSTIEQFIWHEEAALADSPEIGINFVGINHAGPTLIMCGTDEQCSFHLPRILSAESIWCQGFSEPGAGSDLASLSTRGVIDGDEIVVTGQKIWTSYGNLAKYQELLIRTDPESPKHAGITWIIADMEAKGVEARPIRQMGGGEEFCEVFYDEARFPIANVVGQINDGWNVARATLSFERGTAFTASQIRLAQRVEALIDLARDTALPSGKFAINDDYFAYELGRMRAEIRAMRAMTLVNMSRLLHQPQPGPEGSMLKLYNSDLSQRLSRLSMEILGAGALDRSTQAGEWGGAFLGNHSASIGGGTSEIQRNIIGERVLGLPRSR
ncbi:MAG: acyl-CoA dehydrogenase family protein [Caulobacterales bacterium]